jgi:hypothetical protein
MLNAGLSELTDFIHQRSKLKVDEQRFVSLKNFDAAEDARLKLRETFIQEAHEKLEDLAMDHERQIEAVNDAHAEELAKFQRYRDRKVLAQQLRLKEEVTAQLQRQAVELDLKKVQIEDSRNKFRLHASKHLHRLEQSIHISIEASLFPEAKAATHEVEILKQEEEALQRAILERELEETITYVKSKQWEDRHILRRQHKYEVDMLETRLTMQLENIVQRYRNVLSSLKTKQNIEWNKLLVILNSSHVGDRGLPPFRLL